MIREYRHFYALFPAFPDSFDVSRAVPISRNWRQWTFLSLIDEQKKAGKSLKMGKMVIKW
jgi:hypothetical protein